MTIARITATRSSTEIISCDVSTPVREAVAILAQKRIGALPVLDNGSVVGIFSERDVIYRLADEGAACLDKRVGDVMTSPPVTVEPSTKIDDALSLMTKRRFRHFPVIENGALVDFVSIGDMVKIKMDEIAQEAEALRTYIAT